MAIFGIYHRNEGPSQSKEVAALQVASGEIWGRAPFGGVGPAVQAYRKGAIIQDRRVEFETEIAPGTESPWEVWWYLDFTPGVLKREKDGDEFASIKVNIIANLQD